MRGISRLAEDLLASEEGLCSMELGSSLVSGRKWSWPKKGRGKPKKLSVRWSVNRESNPLPAE